MKNRVILNGQGFPVVPKGNKIPTKLLQQDVEEQLKRLAFSSYEEGINAAIDSMETVIRKSIDTGHETIPLGDLMKLFVELRKICKAHLPE